MTMEREHETEFGQLLKQYRRAARLTQEELAERAGYSSNYISMLERGVRSPTSAAVDVLVVALGLGATDRSRLEDVAELSVPEAPSDETPTSPVRLVGREGDTARLIALVRDSSVRVLTLTGPGGVGKTSLAEQVVASVRAEFANGSVFVDLAAVAVPDRVPLAIAQALKMPDKEGGTVRDRLLEFLRDKQLLVLLDSVERVLDAAPFIAQMLRGCPRVKVLATSRAPLLLHEEQEYQLQPLIFPILPQAAGDLLQFPAIALFVQRAKHVQPNFPSDKSSLLIVAYICQRLDGLPLAIELAAARVKHVALPVLGERLQDRLAILTGGSRDLPARQQRMSDTIAWSYDLLPPRERDLFQQLSSFVGSWTIEAAEAVCRVDVMSGTVIDGLRTLVDNSLVVLSGARYRMLDTIREFAAKQLASVGRAEEVKRRHADYVIHLAEKVGAGWETQEQSDWYRQAEMELGNVQAALGWLLDRGMTEQSLHLAASIWRFWLMHGDFREGRRWLETGLARGEQVRPDVRAKALWGVSWLAYHQGDYDRSVQASVEGLELSSETGDMLDRRNALTGLGIAAMAQGHYRQALTHLLECVDICRRLGNRWHLATSLLAQSYAAMYLGEQHQALMLLQEALETYRALGDRAFAARTKSALGYAALLREDLHGAGAIFRDALREFSELGERMGTAETLEGLAAVLAVTQRAEGAARLVGAAIALRETIATRPLPFFRDTCRYYLDQGREHLGESAWASGMTEGRSMDMEHATEYALEQAKPSGDPKRAPVSS